MNNIRLRYVYCRQHQPPINSMAQSIFIIFKKEELDVPSLIGLASE